MTEENQSGLSPEQEAYFASGGEKSLEPEAPAQSQQPEQATAEVQTELGRDDKGRFTATVPHAVFHAEREEHKRTRAELDELRSFKAAIEERTRWAEEAKAREAAANQPQVPNPNEDLFKTGEWSVEQIQAIRAELDSQKQERQKEQQHRDFEAKVDAFWKQDVSVYAEKNPDFRDAATWLAEARDKQLQALGIADPRMRDPQWRNQVIDAEVKQVIVAAAQQGRSPAEMFHEIAKSWGYQAKAGQQPGALPEQLQRIETAQERSRTVGATTGAAGQDALSLDAVMRMDRREFDQWYADPKNARRYDRMLAGNA